MRHQDPVLEKRADGATVESNVCQLSSPPFSIALNDPCYILPDIILHLQTY